MQYHLTERFEEALVFAFRLHSQQNRKASQTPYFAHLMAVCARVLEYTVNEDVAIAALLHDAAEDQGGLKVLEEIRQQFGNRVADIVSDCSDTFQTPKPAWKARKTAFLENIQQADPEAILVILADKIHNLSSLERDLRRYGADIWSRFSGGKEGTLWYYHSLSEILKTSPYPYLNAEIQRLTAAVHRLAEQEEIASA
jgi:(p)ppGpp synthase/HD superfamily hydrolase